MDSVIGLLNVEGRTSFSLISRQRRPRSSINPGDGQVKDKEREKKEKPQLFREDLRKLKKVTVVPNEPQHWEQYPTSF